MASYYENEKGIAELSLTNMGGDLGGLGGGQKMWGGGDGPKFEVEGTAHASVPPNILRSTVIECEANNELSKKGAKEEFIVHKWRFLVKKRVIICYMDDDDDDNDADDVFN